MSDDSAAAAARGLYLDLLANVLTRTFEESELRPVTGETRGPRLMKATSRLQRALGRYGLSLDRRHRIDMAVRSVGRDWPPSAETMVGLKRLANIRSCVERVIEDGVSGDLVETGVWRGGTVIYMRAVLKAYGDTKRRVWAADSFKGLPPPDERFAADAGDIHHTFTELAVSRDQVASNFRRYGLLDDQVEFLEGWFSDTLPSAPIDTIAVLRLDGDLYQSTWEALESLYHKVSSGGFVVVDDYGAVPACKQAVEDFRKQHGIVAELQEVDWTAVYWRVP